jgi:anti-anti-sigma regulatory factor
VRPHGHIHSAQVSDVKDRACWTYVRDQDSRRAAVELLADGVRLGQRLGYLGEGPVEQLRLYLKALTDLDSLIEDGSLEILSLSSPYRPGEPIDAYTQLARYAASTDEARMGGYTGLRVVAEVTTPPAGGPRGHSAQTRWRSLTNRGIASRALPALCCYDRRALPDPVSQEAVVAHPALNGPVMTVPFRLLTQPEGLVLAGEVDFFSAEALGRLLALAAPKEGEIVLDLSELDFIDHHGAFILSEFAHRHRSLSIREAPSAMRRICELLDLRI